MARAIFRSLVTAGVLLAAVLLAACGSGDDAGDAGLSELAQRGKQVAADTGCTACHGSDGRGGVGPGWVGLAGSTVTLEDGSQVTADDAYLRRAITDPQAEIVEGYSVKMPEYPNLTDEDLDALVAYMTELG
jgi:cytochrome c oxidase subunit 2